MQKASAPAFNRAPFTISPLGLFVNGKRDLDFQVDLGPGDEPGPAHLSAQEALNHPMAKALGF